MRPASDDGHDEADKFPHPEGDSDDEGGYSYEPGSSTPSGVRAPLVAREPLDNGDVIFDGEEDSAPSGSGDGELVPYAHGASRNVMIADDGTTPILMDLGSCLKARIPIENRSQALSQQDIAGEHSTMAYRAPELFDVKTGTALDEKVDIWVYALYLFLPYSPLTCSAPCSRWAAFCSHSRTYALPLKTRKRRNKVAQ
jgi:serine/threonine kinase 16